MITHIEGKLVEKNPAYVVIDCGGIGYLIHISLHTYSHITGSENCMLYTHLSVREDAHTLYGFIDRKERSVFRHLISVSGVGPNTARLMLSSLSPDELHRAILNSDTGLLQSIKGIGFKTAQRLIIDLKDRLQKEAPGAPATPDGSGESNKTIDVALSALVMLGFAKAQAEKTIHQYWREKGPHITVEELIKASLKNL